MVVFVVFIIITSFRLIYIYYTTFLMQSQVKMALLPIYFFVHDKASRHLLYRTFCADTKNCCILMENVVNYMTESKSRAARLRKTKLAL